MSSLSFYSLMTQDDVFHDLLSLIQLLLNLGVSATFANTLADPAINTGPLFFTFLSLVILLFSSNLAATLMNANKKTNRSRLLGIAILLVFSVIPFIISIFIKDLETRTLLCWLGAGTSLILLVFGVPFAAAPNSNSALEWDQQLMIDKLAQSIIAIMGMCSILQIYCR